MPLPSPSALVDGMVVWLVVAMGRLYERESGVWPRNAIANPSPTTKIKTVCPLLLV